MWDPCFPRLVARLRAQAQRRGVNRLDLRVGTPLTGEAEVPREERARGEGSPAEGGGARWWVSMGPGCPAGAPHKPGQGRGPERAAVLPHHLLDLLSVSPSVPTGLTVPCLRQSPLFLTSIHVPCMVTGVQQVLDEPMIGRGKTSPPIPSPAVPASTRPAASILTAPSAPNQVQAPPVLTWLSVPLPPP